MPRYYCDYCDTYLTHDSPSVRKQHNAGYKHKANVRTYYQQFEEQQTQSLIDQRIKEHLGQQQVGAAFNQHLASFPRPRLPILPTPVHPMMGTSQSVPLVPGLRPPVLPRPPMGVPGYGAVPMQAMVAPPGAPPMPMQVNGLPGPPAMNAPTAVPGGTTTPSSNGATTMSAPVTYQSNSAAPTSGGYDSYNTSASSGLQVPAPGSSAAQPTSAVSQDGFSYS